MTFCTNYQPPFLRRALLAAAALALLTGGCNSSANSTSSGGESTTGAGGRIDINCVGSHVQSPPEAFHYSYKVTVGGSVDKEAEITPQSMEVTIQDNSGSHKYHGVRSDDASWNNAVLSLSGSGFTAMSARIDSVKNKSSVVRAASAESMNGYQTTKYSIDTANASSSELRAYEAFFGSGSYEKGTLWTTADGCPVKLILDEATKQANGSVDKVHYELDMIKR